MVGSSIVTKKMNRYVGYPSLSGEESMRLLDALEIPLNFYTLYILLRRKTIRLSHLHHLLTGIGTRVSKHELRWWLAQLETSQIVQKITYEEHFYVLNSKYMSTLVGLYQDTLDEEIHQLALILERTHSIHYSQES